MQKLAVDIGYGQTKIKSENNLLCFPSSITTKKYSHTGIGIDEVYNYEGIDYLVGDLAIRDAMTTRDYTFLEKFAPLLLFKAIQDAQLDFKNEINLVTGLSLLNWKMKEQFAFRITDFIVNKIYVNNIKVMIIPQGKGIYLNCVSSMPELKDKLVIVIDSGYNTLDLIPFENGKPLAHEAWSTGQGMNLIVSELGKNLNREYQMSMNEAKINKIMQQGFININGEEKDLSIIIESEKVRYQQLIINEIQTHNPDLYKSADAIIIGGGGAYTLEYLNFNRKIIFAPKPYEFSNVLGYWDILTQSVQGV